MPDNKKKIGSPDSKRISKQPHERIYWASELGCTQAELEKAVAVAGDSVEKVREYLKNKKR